MATGLEIAWLLEKLWALLFVIVWYWKVRLDKANAERDKQIIALQTAQVTNVNKDNLPAIIKSELEVYRDDQKEVKILLKALSENLIGLSKEVAIQQAIGNLNDHR